MKIYVVVTVDFDEKGGTIAYYKNMHLFKDQAFAECIKKGENACVMEFEYKRSWNKEQMHYEGWNSTIE